MPTNDTGLDIRDLDPQADAHGQAALVLVESLLHGLMERSVLTINDTMDIFETAIDVQADFAEAADGSGQKMWRSHALLSSMATSLKHDLDDTKDEYVNVKQY